VSRYFLENTPGRRHSSLLLDPRRLRALSECTALPSLLRAAQGKLNGLHHSCIARKGYPVPKAKDRLIDSTIELIATNGVAGTGISELIALSDVSRRTVYVNFPGGKSELVTDATRSAGRTMTDLLSGLVSNAPIESALTAFGAWWADTLRASGFTRGCPIVAAALGRSEAPGASDAARATFEDWGEVLRGGLEADGFDAAESQSLAVTIVAAVEGAVVMCLAQQSVDPLDQVIRQLSRLVMISAQPDHGAAPK
jgi:TetR/AcrR family transcriptional repressor of lmrAB and yxaGH operons